jgi:hypothetical protein
VARYLEEIVPPVLACFTDQDARVRYYACESMYNIAKVAKGEILVYFNQVFDALCKVLYSRWFGPSTLLTPRSSLPQTLSCLLRMAQSYSIAWSKTSSPSPLPRTSRSFTNRQNR